MLLCLLPLQDNCASKMNPIVGLAWREMFDMNNNGSEIACIGFYANIILPITSL